MAVGEVLTWQTSLFDDAGEPRLDERYAGLVHTQLDDRSWVEHLPGWLTSADAVFAELLTAAPWAAHDRHMYGHKVAQPRLTAGWHSLGPDDTTPFPVLDGMRAALSHRYDKALDSIGLNLYRDGRDSVAWHGDRIARTAIDPLVAIVSVGERRRFLLRPGKTGPSTRFDLGGGDLLVMGGACQREWQHTVPKVAAAGPRISITFRHSR